MDHTVIELTGSDRLATMMQVTDEEIGNQKFTYRFFRFWGWFRFGFSFYFGLVFFMDKN